MLPRRSKWRPRILAAALLAASPLLVTCEAIEDLCTPQHADYGFFSRGDCVFTRAATFQGHEWITVLGNRMLDAPHRFNDSDIRKIAEGNRRVDWPKELLVSMNNGVFAYIEAVEDYTNEPSRQADHFLLSDRDSREEALAAALTRLRALTNEAVRNVKDDPERSLVAIGKATHLIQDSYSEAHTRRDPDDAGRTACIVKIKAYIPRAKGFDTPDIEYHGGIDIDDDDDDDDRELEDNVLKDGIGHTTTQDSIFRPGRDCRSPAPGPAFEACLSDATKRARDATADYLALVDGLRTSYPGSEDVSAIAEATAKLDAFIATHMRLCP